MRGDDALRLQHMTAATQSGYPKIQACIDYWAEWLQGMAV